jgi:PAS domain S-box-containing protein
MGEPLILAIVRDISEQKIAASTIRRLTKALEQVPLLVIITDNKGTIEYVNAKVIEQTGYEYHEIIGQNSRMLQSDKTPGEIYQSIWDLITNGQTWKGELLNINKKGEHYQVSATISPLLDENDEETTHYLAVMNPVAMSSGRESGKFPNDL